MTDMESSSVFNVPVKVKQEPRDDEDYCTDIENVLRESPARRFQEYDENRKTELDYARIEFECRDVKPGADLLAVTKIENESLDRLRDTNHGNDHQTHKNRVKIESVDEVKKELNLSGEIGHSRDTRGKKFTQKGHTVKVYNRVNHKSDASGKKFSLKGRLDRHDRPDLFHKKILNTCDICGKSFSRKFNLKVHIDAVHKNITHACDVCEKKFSTKGHLKTHMHKKHIDAVHNGIAYTCNTCGKTFSLKSNLKIHIDAVHNGITHTCNLCEKTFKWKLTLKAHVKSIHDGVIHSCNICGKTFLYRTNLSRHAKSHN